MSDDQQNEASGTFVDAPLHVGAPKKRGDPGAAIPLESFPETITPPAEQPPMPGPAPAAALPDAPGLPVIPDVGQPTLTREQSAVVMNAIYKPTCDRIKTLIDNLVQRGDNGDYALWAILDTFNAVLSDMEWRHAPDAARDQFLALISLALRRYADLIHLHRGQPAPKSQAEWDATFGFGVSFAKDCYDDVLAAATGGKKP